ncbi:MAG: NAD+ synthase [Elusimicrobia bacterium]|nr:NAD+ synthase [Elusimicrobiota bacterium]
MKVALAQINTKVGDIEGNISKIKAWTIRAKKTGAELVLFPELSVPGYPSWDLLEQNSFIQANEKALQALARWVKEPAVVVGFADKNPSRIGKPIFNAAAFLYGGKILAKRAKTLLPTYDVFDEARYFQPATSNLPFRFKGRSIGLTICEDAWNDQGFWSQRFYSVDPVRLLTRKKVNLLLNISSSPFDRGKLKLRYRMLQAHAKKAKVPFLYCNLVGGNDELLFDGNSMAFDGRGNLLGQGKAFQEDLIMVEVPPIENREKWQEPSDIEQVYQALLLGIRDYTEKCGFKDVLLGLSGGIDSAVCCALAVAALGREHVSGISMPSLFSSEGSITDAEDLANTLRIRFLKIPITPLYKTYRTSLEPFFLEYPEDVTEQNIQARIRGNLLMALSNKFRALLLSTGNKSELSMGYCTLYGDMSGGLAVLGDVPKSTVYELARYINRDQEIIPRSSLEKAPSAELKSNQKDQDDLPPYELLDRVLKAYIEEGKDIQRIASQLKLSAEFVFSLIRRVDANEYKRRQAPPVLKITPKAFGIGRRMPIARGYLGSK